MKLLQITALIIFIAGIHLAGADSDNFTVFLWSKVVGACLLGVVFFITRRKEIYDENI